MAGGGGFAAEAALSGVRPMDLVPLLNLPEPIPESSGVVVLMQHFLESELGGLEQVRVPRPRHELGSTISCHLEGSRGPESSSSALAPSRSKGTETCCVFCSPRYQPRMFRKARRRHICPHRHTRPCHVPLSTSWRPAFGDWHVRPPPPETWSPIRAQRHRSPLHHRPHRPALARALEASATPRSCQLPLLAPACAPNSLPPSSFTLPCPPRLVWSRQCP